MKLLSILLILNIMQSIYKDNPSHEIIYFGGGCFWCVEAVFEDVNGVIDVVSGYAGGKIKNPSYRDVSSGRTEHAEVCKITYDKSIIALEELLEIFFLTHDPTTLNRQGNDIGRHYRSIIFFNTQIEEKIIKKYVKRINHTIYDKKMVTEIKQYNDFYLAENYHQGYYKLNNQQPYCKIIINPKLLKARKKLNKYY